MDRELGVSTQQVGAQAILIHRSFDSGACMCVGGCAGEEINLCVVWVFFSSNSSPFVLFIIYFLLPYVVRV